MKYTRIVIFCLLVMVCLPLSASATVYYVDGNSDMTGDGKSWFTPKLNIQSAINSASSGDEVHVRGSITYHECITLKEGVKVLGGYIGSGETRDMSFYVTVIDGTGKDNSVVTAGSNITTATVIDGFTIQNGVGTLVSGYKYGGGIYCIGSPTISNNIIQNNTARNGGGIATTIGTTPNINHNVIMCNHACNGAGVMMHSGALNYNTVTQNTCTGTGSTGGGISLDYQASPEISHNEVTNNSADYGGGFYGATATTVTISNCNISGNTATLYGGGVHFGMMCIVLRNNRILNNNVTSGSGGGISYSANTATISQNLISGNHAATNGGGILLWMTGRCYVYSNIITSNTATNGGGLYTCDNTSYIANNTVTHNTASSDGGGIYSRCDSTEDYGRPTIKNMIVAYNSSGIYHSGESSPIIGCNDVYSNTGYEYSWIPPAGDYSFEPGLTSDGYHLASDSACIDNGYDAIVGTSWVDVDGQPRKVDIIPGNAQVDIGAHEYTEATLPIDTLTLTASYKIAMVGQHVMVTANAKDANGNNIVDKSVYFTQTGGVVISPTSGQALTDSSGNAAAVVTRYSEGKVTVTAYEYWSSATRIIQTVDIWFYEPMPDDWPMYMHDAQHTGMSKTWDIFNETLANPEWMADVLTYTNSDRNYASEWWVGSARHPNPGWTVTGTNTYIFRHPFIDSSPVVVGNKVVVGTWNSGDYSSATGSVKAFDADDGTPAWTSSSMGGVASTPCISGNYVYVGATDGYLYCLRLSDGSQVWARRTMDRSITASSKILSSPVVYGGAVYITNEASKVYAFSADLDGRRIWSDEPGYTHDYSAVELPIDQPGHGDDTDYDGCGNGVTDINQQNICGASSPAIAVVDSVPYLIVGCDDGYLYRINISSRALVGLYMSGCVESSPSVSGNSAFVGVSIFEGKNIRRVQIEPFEELANWQPGERGEEARACVSLVRDFAYIGVDTGHEFFKLDAYATGEYLDELFSFGSMYYTEYFVGSAAHTTGGIVYTGNDNGCFYALSDDDLMLQSVYSTSGYICSSPAIAYNVGVDNSRWVFITTRADGGKLCAFKTTR